MDEGHLRDVKEVIARSTSKVTLKELEKQGFRKVKVLKQNDIHDLIQKAVDAVLAARGAGVGDKDREQYIEESKAELKRLMKQAAEAQKRQADLESELRRLQAQKVQMEEERKALARRVEQGKAGQDEVIAQYEAQITALQRETGEVATVRETNLGLEQQVADLSRRLQEAEGARSHWLEAEGAAPEELDRLRAEHAELGRKLKNVTVARNLLEQVEIPKLREDLDQARLSLEEERGQRERLQGELNQGGGGAASQRLEDMFQRFMAQMQSRPAETDAAALQEQLARMSEQIADRVSKRVGTGAPVAADSGQETTAEVALAGLFAHEDQERIESNIGNVAVKTKQESGGVKSNLAKLRALKGDRNG
ncbi:MAG: hypothetical protein HY722_16880 [Planctomycetes bacterium]|nr:hypothetical protein [Planctomycetota bacterium]